MTVPVSRLVGIDHTTGEKKTTKLGGSLALQGNTLVDGAIQILNGAGVAVTVGQVLYKNATNDEYDLANATDSSTAPIDKSKYAMVLEASIADAATGAALKEGRINGILVGATSGDRYYLDTSNGAITTTAPVVDDNVLVPIGHALNATDFFFDVGDPIEQ